MIKPLGFRVLIEPCDMEKVTEGGIVLPDTTVDRQKAVTQEGYIVDVGPSAWKDLDKNGPWAKVGDKVLYSKYGTKRLIDPTTSKEYVLANDEDIMCKIED